MKNIYSLTIILVLCALLIICTVSFSVNAEREQIRITENILFGEKEIAKGLKITTKNHLDYHLFWETEYQINNTPITKTEFSYYHRQHIDIDKNRRFEGVSFDNGIGYGFDENIPDYKLTGIQKAYKELFDATARGEEKSQTYYLKDYYDYYPLGVSFDLPYTAWTGYEDTDNLANKPNDALYVTEKFREFFKIPVSENDYVQISVTKGEDGRLFYESLDNENSYTPYTIGTVSRKKNRCFFTINNYISENLYVDTSLINGGYGIYSFYYAGGDSAERTGILADTLKNIYPLPNNTLVRHINLNNDETKLLLFTIEDKKSYLHIIDIENMQSVQKILIGNEYINTIYQYDDFLVADLENTVSIISNNNDFYSLEYNVLKASFTDEQFMDFWNADYMDFKDGKLAVVGNSISSDSAYGYEACDFFVSIYNKNGLIYYGIYDTSLDINWHNSDYKANCHPHDIDPNKIEWDY